MLEIKKRTEYRFPIDQRIEEKRRCPICKSYIVGNFQQFKSHMFTVHNTKCCKNSQTLYTCKRCSKPFKIRACAIRHLVVHDVSPQLEKIFICDFCGNTYKRKANIIMHLHKHQKIGRVNHKFHCEFCDVFYCENRLLKLHIRKQHYENISKNITDKAINESWIEKIRNSNIYIQIRKINDNVITVQKCSNFIKKSLQETDSNNIWSLYREAVCNYCNKTMLKRSLMQHIKDRHMKKLQYQCKTCKVSYSRYYRFVNHVCGKVRNNSCVKKKITLMT